MNGSHIRVVRPASTLLRVVMVIAILLGQLSAVPVTYAQDAADESGKTIFIPFAANPDGQIVTEQPTPGSIAAAPVGQGFNLNASDLRFIMKQIRIAERHAANLDPLDPCAALVGPNPDQIPIGTGQTIELPWGLRTVDGSCNHLTTNQETFGTADQTFPRLLTKELRTAEAGTDYNQTSGTVTDSQPRRISNLIVDQTETNPAAVAAAGDFPVIHQRSGTLFIPNTAPDVGLSAPFNSWFTLFGQFFDHGLDLVNKGGRGAVFIPLQADDPLFVTGSPTNFMVLTRATHNGNHEGRNQTSSWVDQSQTYTSHPSHQVFLRQYTLVGGRPVGTGGLLTGPGGGMATWADVKTQALTILGIQLNDMDALNIPLLATDPYGRFLRGANGFPQVVKGATLVEGNLAAPVNTVGATLTGHAFLDDIAHTAVPNVNNTHDSALLADHFIAGDGRVNENIGLTAVHHIFHAEHNRLVLDIQNLINTDPAFTAAERAAWSDTAGPAGWDLGERLFQAARFVTEMEYQHLAFEEFIRKVQPMVNAFGGGGSGFHPSVDGAIRAEFAHAVYRFGHSMLTETVDRFTATGAPDHMDLLNAFLNPRAFLDGGQYTPEQAAGAIVRGMTSQVGNEIDEFVTEALRNQLLGLPLDLATLNMARSRETGIPRLNEARRQFYAASQNSALLPYESWLDFGFAIRHPESLPNFIAAYGRHSSITGTMAQRRAAAQRLVNLDTTSLVQYAVVSGAGVSCPSGQPTDYAVVALSAPTVGLACYASTTDADNDQRMLDQTAAVNNFIDDATDFLNSARTYAPVNGRTVTGVDDIDLWMGGLAEKQMVFGGLLGPTFNYVFEKQMEDLQDGDRFYYLSRTAGLNLLVQLEGNSFAELIQRNTDAEGLPADVFSRPAYVFNLANLGTSGAILEDPNTEYLEATLLTRMGNTIRYGGPEHVVFNGTANTDRVWSSEGDDTVRGNDNNDWMQGGDGNDNLIGGLGDDILLDSAGDDTLKGGDGDDVLSSGQGFAGDLNQGGRGNDYIVGGNDITESFGGSGNDFIYGGDSEDTVFGDDGDDWIEGGRGPFNQLQGDNGAPFQNDLNQPGHDVIIGYGGEQDYDAEGGDDIMLMGPGIQRAEGMLGFDWSTHKSDPLPADSDMRITGLLPPTVETNRDRFDLVEALSGWNHKDILRGDDRTTAEIAPDHTLDTAGIARISGLAALLPAGVTSFSGGNILIGGAGSDLLEGRGGDDLIDGDRWLDVQIRVGNTTEFHDVMATLNVAVFNGQVDPGSLTIVRTIRLTNVPADCGAANAVNCDVALFSGNRAEYTITQNGDGTIRVDHNGGIDGVDTLRNIEILRFLDGDVTNLPAGGAVTLNTITPVENQALSVASSVSDPSGIASPITHIWQAETAANVWTVVGTGDNFTPNDSVVGLRLRVVASFTDGTGNPETVASAPTAATAAVNDAPSGLPTLSTTAPQVNVQVSAITSAIADADGLGAFSYQWRANGTPIGGATAVNFTPTATQLGQTLSVVVSYTDLQGFAETVTSANSAAVTAATGGSARIAMPANLNFDRRRIGVTVTRAVEIRNTGTAPLVITSATVSGAPFSVDIGTCNVPVLAGRRCRVNVTFAPTAAQLYLGTLTVVSNASNGNAVMNLRGTGR